MKHFYLSMEAISPLAIRSDHAQGGAETLQHIPGTALLGSLASTHRMLRPTQDTEFASFFLNDEVSMPFLYPAKFSKSDTGIAGSIYPVSPLPKTAQTCKRFPGFQLLPGEESDEDRHGIRDSVLDWTTFSLLNDEKQDITALLNATKAHDTCTYTSCQQVMDSIRGYYRSGRSNLRQRMQAKVETHLQTRTGINREWGVVEESILYNREVFDEGMRFWGEAILPDALTGDFKNFIDEANDQAILRIGTGRTRGMGNVRLVLDDEAEMKDTRSREIDYFDERLRQFHNALITQAREAGVRELAPFYFAVTLQSPTILCDPFLRYQKTLDVETLSKALHLSPQELRCVYQITGVQRITGWNELWGTPRTNDYAIEMGSVFVFSCTQEQNKELAQSLATLEEAGIGRRRSEGFGRIVISDPFHLEGEQS